LIWLQKKDVLSVDSCGLTTVANCLDAIGNLNGSADLVTLFIGYV
jgi:hypothetical protein